MSTRSDIIRGELLRVDGHGLGSRLSKHRKMALSPFVFFRGSAALFYRDLAERSVSLPDCLKAIPETCVMGDCHLSNFGFLTEEGSHGDTVIFSPNDFDDACVGRPEWDIFRYCVSLVLCADHCQGIVSGCYPSEKDDLAGPCISESDVANAIDAFLKGYLQVCVEGLDGNNHLSRLLTGSALPASLIKRYKKAKRRAAGGDQFETKSALAKAIEVDSPELFFRTLPKKFKVLTTQEEKQLEAFFAPYMDDSILDIVERVNAGTGSVNMRRYYVLVGPDYYAGKADLPLCHIVEIKLQREAAPLYYFPDTNPTNTLNPAHLTVVCQQRMQRRADLILDEAEWREQHWLIRSRHHAKVGTDPEHVGLGRRNVEEHGFVEYAHTCGTALALAHCRSDRRSLRFESAVSTYLPQAEEALSNLAFDYATQVIKDHQWLKTQEL